MMTKTADVLIVGAGIAGASCGYYLARDGVNVVVLERESLPGYHSTGRSAALFSETYGPPMVRKLSTASRRFLDTPPDGFTEHPLLDPRGLMQLAEEHQLDALDAAVVECRANGAEILRLDAKQLLDIVPILRPGVFAGGSLERDAMDIDVHALHQGFLRGLKQSGGTVETNAEVEEIARRDGRWTTPSRPRSSSTPPAPGPMSLPRWQACRRWACNPSAAPAS
jgi:D-arginine dehydrogenase